MRNKGRALPLEEHYAAPRRVVLPSVGPRPRVWSSIIIVPAQWKFHITASAQKLFLRKGRTNCGTPRCRIFIGKSNGNGR